MAIKNNYQSTIFQVSRNISHWYWYCRPLSLQEVLTTRTRQCGTFVVFVSQAGAMTCNLQLVVCRTIDSQTINSLPKSANPKSGFKASHFFLNKELGEDFQVDKLGTSVLEGIFRWKGDFPPQSNMAGRIEKKISQMSDSYWAISMYFLCLLTVHQAYIVYIYIYMYIYM